MREVSGTVTFGLALVRIGGRLAAGKNIMRLASILPSALLDSLSDSAPKAASVVVATPELN